MLEDSTNYAPFYDGIIRTARRSGDTRIDILSYINHSKHHVDTLTKALKDFNKQVFTLQLNSTIYGMTEIIEHFNTVKASTVVILFSWYLTENLLERLASYAVNHITFITVEAKLAFIRYVRQRNPHLRVSNVMRMEKLEENCNR